MELERSQQPEMQPLHGLVHELAAECEHALEKNRESHDLLQAVVERVQQLEQRVIEYDRILQEARQ